MHSTTIMHNCLTSLKSHNIIGGLYTGFHCTYIHVNEKKGTTCFFFILKKSSLKLFNSIKSFYFIYLNNASIFMFMINLLQDIKRF